MVDEDNQACRIVAKWGYLAGMWPESYITWDFLKQHPKAMEPAYLNLDWNHILGMYCRKNYLCSLVIEQEEWDRLSDPAFLAHYWEPTQEPSDFHRTFALLLCQSWYSNCEDESHKQEYVVSVAIIRKLARFAGVPFALAADEFNNPTEKTTALLMVWLHCQSRLFPDIYYDQYHSHFTMMHVSGEHYNIGHPQKYMGALLHNAYMPGEDPHSPKAKLPLAYMDNTIYKFPIDSCM